MRSFYLPLGLAAAFLQSQFAAAQSTMPTPSGAPATLSSAINAATTTGANHAAPLTLAAAIGLALQRNPELLAAARDIDVADGQLIQAGARPNPELALLSEGLHGDNRSTTVQLNQALELGGKRAARLTLAQREREVALADLASRAAEVRAATTGAFFGVLAAQERRDLALASQTLALAVADAATRRVSAGKISPLEQTRAKVALAGSRIELSQADSELALGRRRLAACWGGSAERLGELAAPEQAPTPHASLPELLTHLAVAPQLARARLEIARQHAGVELERSRRVPDLTLSLGSKRDEQAGRRQTVVGLSVPLPLFDTNRGNLLSALRKTDKARDELAATESRLTLELSDAFLRDQAARAELAMLRADILPGAHSAYEAATKGFELGKFNFLDVLDAQRTLFQAKAQYLRALAESHRAATDMERLVGIEQQHVERASPAEQP